MPKSILVVEDEPSLCNALCKMLIKANFEVNRATDGREGLDLALKNHPDLTKSLDKKEYKEDGVQDTCHTLQTQKEVPAEI